MVELKFTDGQSIWVNPSQVVSVRRQQDQTVVTLADREMNGWIVSGSADEVLSALKARPRTEVPVDSTFSPEMIAELEATFGIKAGRRITIVDPHDTDNPAVS